MSYRWSSGDTTATCVVSPSQTQTYRVTVTFDNGCTNYDSVAVLVTDLEFPTITGIDTICFGKSTTLTASHPTSNQFHWNTGQTASTITVSPQVTTTYIVSATMIGDCIVTDTLTVTVLQLPKPQFQATPTEIYVENGIGTVNCVNLTPGDNHLVWNFGDVFSNLNIIEDVEDPAHDYTHSGYYTITLTATDSLGCVDSVKNRVSVEVPYFFYIPNSFTPDGDGVNEYFAPQGQGVDPENYLMQIFDRSGMLIYTTHNPYDYWDGRNKYGQKCPEGVYVYRILLRNLNVEDKEYTGTVTLIR
jgi:gliding motility-associated-like protein